MLYYIVFVMREYLAGQRVSIEPKLILEGKEAVHEVKRQVLKPMVQPP